MTLRVTFLLSNGVKDDRIFEASGFRYDANSLTINDIAGYDTVIPANRVYTVETVVEKLGRWEKKYVTDDPLDPLGFFRHRYYCSVCGNWNTYGESKFCPKCGHEMLVPVDLEEFEW